MRSIVLLASVAVLFAFPLLCFADNENPVNPTASSGKSSKTSKDSESGRSKRSSKTKSNETGGSSTNRTGFGSRKDRTHDTSIARELQLVPLVLNEAVKGGVITTTTIDQVLTIPLKTPSGRIRTSVVEGIEAQARINSDCGELVDQNKIRAQMIKMQMLGITIQRELAKVRLPKTWSYADWQGVAGLIAAKAGEKPATGIYPVDSECRFWNEYKKVKCGACILDLTNQGGLPTLICNEVRVLTPETVNGEAIKVSTSDRAAETTYTEAAHTIDDYVRWAAGQTTTVDAWRIRKQATSISSDRSSKADMMLKAMEKKTPPKSLMSMIGLGG